MMELTDEWRAKISEFLDECVSMTVATVSPNGSARAADVYFVSDKALNLYFYSDPASRHSRNISRDRKVAATVRHDSMDWREIKGVQVEGIIEQVTSLEGRAESWRLMCKKFPFYEAFTDVVEHLAIYRISPSWIRWIDNGVSFGHKVEFALGER